MRGFLESWESLFFVKIDGVIKMLLCLETHTSRRMDKII